ncbi:MAG: prolipoprotein diacylglyceryl transferase [Hyphomonadaceae bacterium]|nr:prolipoprotein diacylglyceryl transferase [Hyphomonadaceae bacterium]
MLDVAIQFPDFLRPEIVTLGPLEVGGLSLGPFVLRWYALAYIAGLLLGWRYMAGLVRNEKLWGAKPGPVSVLQLDDFLFWATIGVIVGGRIGYVLFYKPDMIWKNPGEIVAIWHGGMSFHGGLIGVALAVVFFARRHKLPMWTLGDLAAAAAPIGLFFGRLANFVNAELYGRASTAPWAVMFPQVDVFGQVSYTEPRHPSQLYEAALEGVFLFFILRHVTHRRLLLQKPGVTAGVFLIGYGVFRFLVEFVREPDAHMPEALRQYVTMGMLLCLPMIALGALLAWRGARAKPA